MAARAATPLRTAMHSQGAEKRADSNEQRGGLAWEEGETKRERNRAALCHRSAIVTHAMTAPWEKDNFNQRFEGKIMYKSSLVNDVSKCDGERLIGS